MLSKLSVITALVTIGLISYSVNSINFDQIETKLRNFRQTIENSKTFQNIQNDPNLNPIKVLDDVQRKKYTLNMDPNIPEIYSLSSWISDLKTNPKLGSLKINQLALPGAHHAGLTNVITNETVISSMFDKIGLQATYKEKESDKQFIQSTVNSLFVPHRHDIDDMLFLGARYLDLKVATDQTKPSQVYLAHCLLSNITLQSALISINKFIKKNPGEIIIIDVSQAYYPLGNSGGQVSSYLLDSIIRENIDPQYILTRQSVSKPISSYGGVYITGYTSQIFSTIVLKSSWQLTKGDNSMQVVTNLKNYYESGAYVKQQPLDYDFLKSNTYLTPSETTLQQTVIQEADSEGRQFPLDPLVSAEYIPADNIQSSRLTNPLFFNTLNRSPKMYQALSIIEMADFNSGDSIRVIQLNINRHF
ncbi:pi-plc x domain-containing protein 1-like [Stylonychia lemnae]|uniref:Pi-plc x domain-containing protein 1-like n=1 Tax=Stylonychia lemnae TaxID=5949 RepID=A0A077ZVX6_STYLE|nr:pi-plc x domain-containing protein 1-like [Stylonychia lemnae]|eukprot:CDW72591.1 pi-plc x domain-containing protein 1-like [Stylonychia lemnae]